MQTTQANKNKVDQWIVIATLSLIFCLCIALMFAERSIVTVASLDPQPEARRIDDPSQTTAASVINQTPAALASSGEQETRNALSRLFGKTFVKVRPPFLVNPETGRRLELDCFNQELMLGVEYNGIQHYVYPNPFHRTQLEFEAQLRRDRYKADQCKTAGVQLITVPFTTKRVDIESYLRQALDETKMKLNC
jgi:hypothetical protein